MLDLAQYADLVLLGLRVAVGAVFLAHALPKLKSPEGMAKGMGWPKAAVVLLGAVEALGALYLITGFLLQVGALALAVVMLGAMYHKIMKWKMPFVGTQKLGWELDLVLLASVLLLATIGGGSIGL